MTTIVGTRTGGTLAVPGLRLRPYAGEADLIEIARVSNAEYEADGLPGRTSVEELRAEYAHPNAVFDPARDVTIAEVDGQLVGVGSREVVETTDGFREYRMDGVVDPAWRRRGIGRAILSHNQRRHSARIAAADDATLRPIFGSWSGASQDGDNALLRASGFEPARYFFNMLRPTLADVPELALPDGLEVRPIDMGLTRAVWQADIEAFADHWGGFDHSDESLQRWLDMPSNDLSLWIVAFDGDEVAGGVLNVIDDATNGARGIQRGWLGGVFTRRPWRRRGLARALIARSLIAFRERGMTSAALGVDADNPSGAFGLYENLGFGVDYRSIAWRRELR